MDFTCDHSRGNAAMLNRGIPFLVVGPFFNEPVCNMFASFFVTSVSSKKKSIHRTSPPVVLS